MVFVLLSRARHSLLQAYASSKVSQSYDVWGLGIIATKVFLGRDQEEQKKDVSVNSFKTRATANTLCLTTTARVDQCSGS